MDLEIILGLMVVADLLWWARADARLRPLRGAASWRLLLGCWVVGQAGYILLWLSPLGWARSRGSAWVLPLHVCVYLWHLLVLPLLCLAMVFSIVRRRLRPTPRTSRRQEPASAHAGGAGVIQFSHKCDGHAEGGATRRPGPPREAVGGRALKEPAGAAPTPEAPAGHSLSRRQLIAAAAVALPPLAAAGVTGGAVARLGEFRVRGVDVLIPGLPPDLHGLTIAQVTDLHLGKFTRDGMVRRVAEATNALSADLVVFTGDLIDLSQEDLPAGIDFIRGLKPRHGPGCLAMIEGNHDLLEHAAAFEEKVRDAGLPLLIDEAMTIRVPGRRTPVQLLGLRWGVPPAPGQTNAERLMITDASIAASVGRVLDLREPDAFPLLLSHHPHALDPAAAAGLPLTLAGHTHGGQLMLTDHVGAGPLRFRYWTGFYRKAAGQLFVCNGVGNWFPLRVNAPCEIVKLTLKRA